MSRTDLPPDQIYFQFVFLNYMKIYILLKFTKLLISAHCLCLDKYGQVG